MNFLRNKAFAFLLTVLVFSLNSTANAQELVYNYESNETVSIITKEDFSEGFDNQANKINFELARECFGICEDNCASKHKNICRAKRSACRSQIIPSALNGAVQGSIIGTIAGAATGPQNAPLGGIIGGVAGAIGNGLSQAYKCSAEYAACMMDKTPYTSLSSTRRWGKSSTVFKQW